jgi:hypothetical protein
LQLALTLCAGFASTALRLALLLLSFPGIRRGYGDPEQSGQRQAGPGPARDKAPGQHVKSIGIHGETSLCVHHQGSA